MPLRRLENFSYGYPLPGVLVRIEDFETGEELPPGERGEIVVKSPVNLIEYYNKPEKTEEMIENG